MHRGYVTELTYRKRLIKYAKLPPALRLAVDLTYYVGPLLPVKILLKPSWPPSESTEEGKATDWSFLQTEEILFIVSTTDRFSPIIETFSTSVMSYPAVEHGGFLKTGGTYRCQSTLLFIIVMNHCHQRQQSINW